MNPSNCGGPCTWYWTAPSPTPLGSCRCRMNCSQCCCRIAYCVSQCRLMRSGIWHQWRRPCQNYPSRWIGQKYLHQCSYTMGTHTGDWCLCTDGRSSEPVRCFWIRHKRCCPKRCDWNRVAYHWCLYLYCLHWDTARVCLHYTKTTGDVHILKNYQALILSLQTYL